VRRQAPSEAAAKRARAAARPPTCLLTHPLAGPATYPLTNPLTCPLAQARHPVSAICAAQQPCERARGVRDIFPITTDP